MSETIVSGQQPKQGQKVEITTGLGLPAYDYIGVDESGATTDVYTYKKSGATVATLTITYTDSTKTTISTIVKS